MVWDGAESSLDYYSQFGQRFSSFFKLVRTSFPIQLAPVSFREIYHLLKKMSQSECVSGQLVNTWSATVYEIAPMALSPWTIEM